MVSSKSGKGNMDKIQMLEIMQKWRFISNEFNNFYIERGIKRQVSTPGTPKKNGIVERRNISIMDCAKTLMIEKNIATKYWNEAIKIAIHTLNQVQLKKDTFKTPYELWYGYKPNVINPKVFGSNCYILKESRKGKFDVKGDEGIFLGYSCKSKAGDPTIMGSTF